MRKLWMLLAIFILLSGTAYAQDINVVINGQGKSFDPAPQIKDGRTLVPMRAFFEALGAQVDWDSATQTAIGARSGIEVRIPIGSNRPTVNGMATTIDVPAQIIDGRTFIPLRFVGEALGDQVVWDNGTIRITSAGDPPTISPKTKMYAHFIDVGQGDSILVQTPNGKTILIDGGPRAAGQKVVAYLAKAGITSVDAVVLTHAHEDHVGGLVEVLNEIPVAQVYDTGYPHTTKVYEEFLTIIDEKNIKFSIVQAGGQVAIDPAVNIAILYPAKLGNDANNNSIVLKITYNSISVLLTGDAEKEAEEAILASKADIYSQILKIGHHGSRTSTTPAFLAAISPEIAIIQAGAGNSYGHPHPGLRQSHITKIIYWGSSELLLITVDTAQHGVNDL